MQRDQIRVSDLIEVARFQRGDSFAQRSLLKDQTDHKDESTYLLKNNHLEPSKFHLIASTQPFEVYIL